ncbi:MAG: flagellar hook-basal body complex protein FliE [Polyangiaceae bacterium]
MSIAAIGSLGSSYPLTAGRYGSMASASGTIADGPAASETGATSSLLDDAAIFSPSVDPSSSIGGLSGPTTYPVGGGFGEVLAGAVRDAVVAGNTATSQADALARGTNDDIHGTMISAKEADISLKLVGSVRNKLLDAFHELWRTNV